jgi:hypothetical protein
MRHRQQEHCDRDAVNVVGSYAQLEHDQGERSCDLETDFDYGCSKLH